MPEWNDIQDALILMVDDMRDDNGFKHTWKTYHNQNIKQDGDFILFIEADESENTDDLHFTSSNESRETQTVFFDIKIMTQESIEDVDIVNYLCKKALKNAETDVKKNYSSCYNIAGDAGAIGIEYQRDLFIKNKSGDGYAPYKLRLIYEVKYIESRGL